MVEISRDLVLYLAQLSNLELSEGETESLKTDLSDILAYVEQLKELDTKGVEPTYQVTDLANVYRADEAEASPVSPADLLALAPESADHQIKVPKVL